MFRADTVVRVRLFFFFVLLMCSFHHHHLFHNTIPFFSNIFVGLFYNLQFALLQCYIS